MITPLQVAIGELGVTEFPKEEWRDVVGYEGLYEVSNLGNVRSTDRMVKGKYPWNRAKVYGRTLKAITNRAGYKRVNLCNEEGRKAKFIHRLVAEAFIPNTNNLPMINHKDERPCNNRVDNLEWCDAKYNANYGNHNKRVSENARNTHGRAVYATNYETGEVRYFPTLSEAGRQGFPASSVFFAAKNPITKRDKRYRTYRGYFWRYENEQNTSRMCNR